MKRRAVALLLSVTTLLLLWLWLGVGYYYSYIDHDEHAIYFIKKGLTLRRKFINPFANEGDPLPINALAPDVRDELAVYCRYAYGVMRNDEKSLDDCRARIIHDVL
ncbi:hypothetical protein [Caballeronia concitans]|uniref:Uncharacterized protein n=1 Tax=Caballeronia concitans TaxID=1777133 RepID=A0A658QQU1_9BURK|nr:hypothetical protein [Caballeronia concitans]KIG02433.1 hypothetical protein BurMR1_5482 [Burkholderia sp. MR1]SAL11643.1 hypothetical protein AWB72_00346 [Caballeronia concitans]